MCGFAVSNITDINLSLSNEKCKKRGPDKTTNVIVNKIQFLHNLLHITGSYTEQPLTNKNKDIFCVFNGEIYNYKSFSNYNSDGECIIDLYQEYGNSFAKNLDGEFAICLIDFLKNKIILVSDLFASKPLWYEFSHNKFCVASYNSQLLGLNFIKGNKLKANKTIIFNLKNLKKEEEIENHKFNLSQYKKHFDDWVDCFSKSISKRASNTKNEIFIGLSSGYDSGAITCELQKQKINFKSYSIINNENEKILIKRLESVKNKNVSYLSKNEFEKYKKELIKNCENFVYLDYEIIKVQANVGFYFICKKANADKKRITLLGQGADEIISDYGFGGKKIYKSSCFGGLFPEKLEDIFPWCNFWEGTQIKYLNAQEYVAGSFGIEARYPFLDKNLVQEFINLSPKLKNSAYKSCINYYLNKNNYPFEKNIKRGFYCLCESNKNIKLI